MLSPCLDRVLGDLPDAAEILLYFNRNVNPFLFFIDDFKTVPAADGSVEAAEYLYQELDNDAGVARSYLKKLSPEECRSVIADRVADTVREALPKGSTLVVGVSGGGDSNALLYGLTQIKDHDLTIVPLILMGIPDWDAGVPRATQLCADYGLDLTVIDEREVMDLLGMSETSDPLIDRFEREFKGDDFEFLGTLLIRLALSKRARELETPYICTGLNLEDVLCESIFRSASGMTPSAVPARPIGDVTLVFPLWLCPKRIIDGCFPRYSLENYDARYPCFSLGRNLYYSAVYALQSQFPGLAEQMAKGFAQQGSASPTEYEYNSQLGFHVERAVPLPLLQKFQRMIGRSAVVS